jgi:hypothetical protein
LRALQAIGNNAAICVDGRGRQLIALGAGVGFGSMPRDVPLVSIKRTFYGIDDQYLDLIELLPPEELEFAAQFSDIVRSQVSHELSPNLPITLADHISFAVRRAREHMYVQMPLAYDVQQNYPVEYGLGEIAVRGISKTFGVRLPKGEAVGIALSIVNSTVSSSDKSTINRRRKDRLLNSATAIVEHDMGVTVNRDSFDYARFATHVCYLIERVAAGSLLDTKSSDLYPMLSRQHPHETTCAAKIGAILEQTYGNTLTEEELVYLILHVTRVVARAKDG